MVCQDCQKHFDVPENYIFTEEIDKDRDLTICFKCGKTTGSDLVHSKIGGHPYHSFCLNRVRNYKY